MEKNSKIYIAGHTGLLGSALLRILSGRGYTNILLRTHSELNLIDDASVAQFFKAETPEYVFMAAAKVGGIVANSKYPGEFIYENLAIEKNIIHNAFKFGIKKLIFFGSSCMYPRLAEQPIKENYLFNGPVEPTSQAYAIAKLAGHELCRAYNAQYGTNFMTVVPTGVYGPNDHFDQDNSHVMAALIRKLSDAKERNESKVVLWGTGRPTREFLYVDDLADACIFLMNGSQKADFVNVGTGVETSIQQLAELIALSVGYEGALEWDSSKPDGAPRKVLDPSLLKGIGWTSSTNLIDGIRVTVDWYQKNRQKFH